MAQPPPFEFIFELLDPLNPIVRPMFGCHALYVGDKILLIVRKKKDHQADNGVWMASTPDKHESLKKDFPSARPVGLLDGKGGWLNIPAGDDQFEEQATKLCEMILKRDSRIGKIPKGKSKKKN